MKISALLVCLFLMIRRPPRSTHGVSSAASDVYKRQADTSLRALVGSRWAELICLPFTGDLSKARISKRHMCELHPKYESFAENEGKYIAQIDESVLHFLISAECFDNSALDHLAKYSPHLSLIHISEPTRPY